MNFLAHLQNPESSSTANNIKNKQSKTRHNEALSEQSYSTASKKSRKAESKQDDTFNKTNLVVDLVHLHILWMICFPHLIKLNEVYV